MRLAAPALAAVLFAATGCNLIDAKTFSVDYKFDPQEYNKSFGMNAGSFPSIACDGTTTPDPCAQAQSQLGGSGLTVACDTTARACAGSAEVRLSYPVNLSQQTTFPPEVVQYGVSFVTINAVEYWVASNTLTLATPPIDLYVAPATATDESGGTKLGSVAMLGARSTTCGDPVDSGGDDKSMGAMVCDLPLTQAGKDALSKFAADYKTPFQVIAHTVVTVHGGDPLPSGGIDFFVRPSINIGLSK